MFYKPSYCCDCGDRIEKETRKWWQSRRFCDDCAAHLDKFQNRIFKYVAVALALTGIGGFIGASSFSSKKPPLIIAQNQTAAAPQQIKPATPAQTSQKPPNLKPTIQPQNQTPAQTTTTPQPTPEFATEPETAYFCGARTQKGTPCSRRVREPGRCWQHVGKTPMLSEDKLKLKK